MDTNSHTLIPMIAAVIVVIAVVAAGVFILTNDDDNKKSGDEITAENAAEAFAEEYNSIFGTFTINDDATDSAATLTSSVSSSRSTNKYTIDIESVSDAASQYAALKKFADEKGITFPMATEPAQAVKLNGYENAFAYRLDVSMEMTEGVYMYFSYAFFAMYYDDLLVTAVAASDDGTSVDYLSGLYTGTSAGRLVKNSEIVEIINVMLDAIGCDETVSIPSASAVANSISTEYNGIFGTLSVNDGATDSAATLTSSVSSSRSTNKYTIDVASVSDAASQYAALKTLVETKGITFPMASSPAQKVDLSGYDNVFAYRLDVSMEMTEGVYMYFSYVFFAMYYDDLLVTAVAASEDGTSVNYLSGLYTGTTAGRLVKNSEIVDVLNVVLKATGCSSTVSAKTLSASEVANSISTNYGTGEIFGTFTVNDGATDSAATLTSSIYSSRSTNRYTIDVTTGDDVLNTYAVLKNKVGTLGITFPMATSPAFELEIDGFDYAFAYQLDVSMEMTEGVYMYFSYMFFAMYADNTLIQAVATTVSDDVESVDYLSGLYTGTSAGRLMTCEDAAAVLNAAAKALGSTATITVSTSV